MRVHIRDTRFTNGVQQGRVEGVSKARESRPMEFDQRTFDLTELERPIRRLYTMQEIADLHRALAPFIDLSQLRRFAAEHHDVYEALRSDKPPKEIRAIAETLSAVLRPVGREQIKSPRDIAALLMVEMGPLDQEELRTVLLDTKNRLQGIVTVYRGSLNTSLVRVGEVYKEALRRNSAALIVAHNHPSGDPTPSPEDVLITHAIVDAGRLLDVDCLDHLVIGQGKWVSMRERGLGFRQ
jgi:DNA repair protein RadC